MTTNIYQQLYEDEKARWALLLTEKGKMEREKNAQIDSLYERIQDLRDCLREELLDRNADTCSDCGGTGGQPIEQEVLSSDRMAISHTETVGFSYHLDSPCESCCGVGVLA